jgi:hypothetical protein
MFLASLHGRLIPNPFPPRHPARLVRLQDRSDFTVTSEGLPGVERSFSRFSGTADEASLSRITAGQHFRFDQDAGEQLGRAVADFVVENFLSARSLAGGYVQHNLVSDLPGMADAVDPNLVNPWGIVSFAASPFWIADNHRGVSTIYSGDGQALGPSVQIPAAPGGGPGAPTGVVFNRTTNFLGALGQPAKFIFSGEDGTLSGWSSGMNAILEGDNSSSHAVYKGLALAIVDGASFLYATDFHNGRVDVFDGEYKGDISSLYFTAGIAGSSGAIEDHGLFGRISAAPPLQLSVTAVGESRLKLTWSGGPGLYLIQTKTNLSGGNWIDLMTTTNLSATIAVSAPANFFRVVRP